MLIAEADRLVPSRLVDHRILGRLDIKRGFFHAPIAVTAVVWTVLAKMSRQGVGLATIVLEPIELLVLCLLP